MKITTSCHNNAEVLKDVWYSVLNPHLVYGKIPSGLCIGIVKIKTEFGEEKTYIGLGTGKSYEGDIRLVLDCGVPYYYEIGV